MKLSEVNEYIQTAAAVVAIAGIFILGFELRQSNELATQQAVSQSWNNWTNWQGSLIESDVNEIVAKSVLDPESLTLADKLRLTDYFLGYIYLYEADFETFSYTSEEVVDREIEEAVDTLAGVFGYPYGRAWFRATNYKSQIPSLMERVGLELDKLPESAYQQFDLSVFSELRSMKHSDSNAEQH